MQDKAHEEVFRFSLIEALYFAIFAISSYQTVFLQGNGLSSTQIGLITSVASIVGLIVVPIWGVVADVKLSAKKTFMFTMILTTVLFCLLPMLGAMAGHRMLFYLLYIPLIIVFKQPTNSLMDSWIIGILSPKGISYGSVRMWGSIGYALVSLCMGFLVGKVFSVDTAFWLMLPLLLILLVTCHEKDRDKAACSRALEVKKKEKFQVGLLLHNRRLLLYLLYSCGLNIYLAVTLIFMVFILPGAGVDPNRIGTVTGFRAVMEIISMVLGAKLAKKVKLKYIMILPGILFAAEHLLYAHAHGMASVLGIMVLSGLAGGFVYSLGPSYIYEIVPASVASTAQTCNTMTMTLISIVGSAVGGLVIENYGVHSFTNILGGIILVLTIIFTMGVFLEKGNREAAK